MSKLPFNDDGEFPFELEPEKPKMRPPSRLWRKTYIPIPLLLAICALLVCSAVLLLSTSFTNGSLLCRITTICQPNTNFPPPEPTLFNDPKPPLSGVPKSFHSFITEATDVTKEVVITATPPTYAMPRCDPYANYHDYLMFSMEEADSAEIFLIAPDGTGLCRLTDNLISEGVSDWSPDHQLLLFTSLRQADYHSDIYVMNMDGTNIVNLTKDQAEDYGGQWSPDGTKIVFNSNRAGNSFHIFIMNADGTDVQDLTPTALNAQTPVWSPDGSQIVYAAGSDGDLNKLELYVVNVSTKQSRRITFDEADEYSPAWSPVDSTLIFTSAGVGNAYAGFDIYSMKLGDSHFQKLTSSRDAGSAAWSPDGKQIAYLENYQLHVLDLSTGTDRTLKTDHQIHGKLVWR